MAGAFPGFLSFALHVLQNPTNTYIIKEIHLIIYHFHLDHNAPCLPPKFCRTIVFNFSLDYCNIQENLELTKCKIFGGKQGA